MNKLSKIFLVIIIILIIIIIGMYINMIKHTLSNNEEIYKITSAVENAGFVLEIKEDGSYVLVEK